MCVYVRVYLRMCVFVPVSKSFPVSIELRKISTGKIPSSNLAIQQKS